MTTVSRFNPYSITEFQYSQLIGAFERGESLQIILPWLQRITSPEALRQCENKPLVDRIIKVLKHIEYCAEQDPKHLPSLTRQIALKILLNKEDAADINLLEYEKLGEGVFGVVTKVEFPSLGVVCAKKCIKKKDLKRQMAFNEEYKRLKECDHPNIIQVLHATRNEIFMKFAPRGHLNYGLPLLNIGEVFQGVARGLEYLHSKRYVHRDIKSENILVMDDFQVKIGDLGFMTTVESFQEKEDLDFSKCRHLSPEYRCQQLKKEDCKKIDIWGLGVLMAAGFLLREKEKMVLIKDPTNFIGFNETVIKAEFDVKKVQHLDPHGKFQELIFACLDAVPSKRPEIEPVLKSIDEALALSKLETSRAGK